MLIALPLLAAVVGPFWWAIRNFELFANAYQAPKQLGEISWGPVGGGKESEIDQCVSVCWAKF